MPITGSQKALMYARSGLARAGATRSDYYNEILILTLGGVDVSQKVRKGTLRITDVIYDQAHTFDAQFFGGVTPVEGQEVIVASGAANNRVFAGHVTKPVQLSRDNNFDWAVQATDYTWKLQKRVVTRQYASGTLASAVVTDLISRYAASDGFTTTNVLSAPAISGDLTFVGTRLDDAIKQVAALVNWNWYVDYNKDIHFFATETSQSPADLIDGNRSYFNLQWAPSIDQIRTRVYVQGGGGATTAPVAVGATSIPVDECGWYSASGGTVLCGSNLATYTGRSASSGPGNLTGVPGAGSSSVQWAIKQGDIVSVWVQRDDAAAQATLAALEGGDGVHEFFVADGRLSIASAQLLGDAELAAYSTTDHTGSFDSYDKFCRSGKTLTVHLTLAGAGRAIASTSILIQKVVRQYAAVNKWVFHCEFSDGRHDLATIIRQLKRALGGK